MEGLDGSGIVNGVEVKVVSEVLAILAVGAPMDQESLDGVLGFLVSMYRLDCVIGGGEGLRGGVWLGVESSTSLYAIVESSSTGVGFDISGTAGEDAFFSSGTVCSPEPPALANLTFLPAELSLDEG